MYLLILEDSQLSEFWFYFLSGAVLWTIVGIGIYFIIVKNPKLNKPKPRRDEEED